MGVISLISVLNKHGHGVLYFVVKNDGSIFGQAIGKDITSNISKEIKNYIRPIISPVITLLEVDNKTVIKVITYDFLVLSHLRYKISYVIAFLGWSRFNNCGKYIKLVALGTLMLLLLLIILIKTIDNCG